MGEMIVKSIQLENIRSYLNQTIEFPEGSTLLSGDIGCGKSTILLSIEFALFGIRKGLSGSTLLRHGKNSGSVELTFVIDGKEISIKRNLKRKNDRIEQDAGYILQEGVKKAATAVELKALIFELIGYPKALISKKSDLLYRYTVYTPQEEMKAILTEEGGARLDTLRKVFGIDKYKKISENALIIARNVKDRRKVLQGRIADLEVKRKQQEGAVEEIKELEKKKEEIMPKLLLAQQAIEEKKEDLEKAEENIKAFNALQQKLEVAAVEEKSKHAEFERIKEEIEENENKINGLRKELEGKDFEEDLINKKIEEIELEIGKLEKSLVEIKLRVHELNVHVTHSEQVKSKILKINRCPMCEQEVSKEYKDGIIRRENSGIHDCSKKVEKYAEEEGELKSKLNLIKSDLNESRDKKNQVAVLLFKQRELLERAKRKDEQLVRQGVVKREIGILYATKNELQPKLESMKGVDEAYDKIKLQVEEARAKEKDFAIEQKGIESSIAAVQRTKEMIDKEISEKLEAKSKLDYLSELLNWIENGFVKLMATMEKQIMLSVHNEFNELFKRWFTILMEDETINVRLDDSFSPIIDQNGYETEVANLSGGEKTSAALAYRLALNKVVNDLMSTIKTKDLIILDEPTDGFSAQQLDNVRDVLDQIGTKQTIIVSHESKIESFVDHVIRINKNEHISQVG